MRTMVILAGVLGLGAAAVGGASEPSRAHPGRDAGERLGARIEGAIKAEGPFFTAEERAVIERKCGYPAGSFDGFEVNINNGVLVCRGGKRVDDAEMRALLAVAEPRIERRVSAVMESAEVQGAIRAVADEATREALAAIDHGRIAREAAAAAREAARDARVEARRR
jgi:hypothetical protein